MDRKNICIIHPQDITTDFLEEITGYLTSTCGINVKIMRLQSQSDHLEIVNTVAEVPQTWPLLFFGHGNSDSLSGARIGGIEHSTLIFRDQLNYFRGRNVFLLSCRSAEYLGAFGGKAGIKAGIGFPNLITHKEDLLYSQNSEREKDITDFEIMLFRELIVDTIRFSLEDFINEALSFYELFKRIQMRIHRTLIKYYSSSLETGNYQLGKMINDMSEGMFFMGN